MLTSFAIGTIDQLLFMALKSRHLVLRHLGLAGKVVVIDEAHAYDVYMSRYLDRALTWLGAYGVPVVVLSATLPAGRRAEMMAAYDEGRLGPPPQPVRRRWGQPVAQADPYRLVRDDQRYPVVSMSGPGREPVAQGCAASGRRLSVGLSTHVDDPLALAETLHEELADGGCVLVVCNTVARVQHTAAVLREQLGPGIPVSVAHSRFAAPDRVAKDRWLRDTFGPPHHVAKAGERPPRHVVVASQVAEQSLDIDFDLLVTDLAPVDLLLQRMGRLHRHVRSGRPAKMKAPRCVVMGADWTIDPPQPVGGSQRVYGAATLLRGAAVLWSRLVEGGTVELPEDISSLVQRAYGDDPPGPSSWHPAVRDADEVARATAQRKRDRAEVFRLGRVREPGRPLLGWLAGGTGNEQSRGGDEARGRAHVRDDGAENLEVLLLVRRGAELVTLPWLPDGGGVSVPTDFAPHPRLARMVASCSLPLPQLMTTRGGDDRVIAELERRNHFPAWDSDPWVGGQLILDIDEYGRAQLDGFALEYNRQDGLHVTKLTAGA